MFDFRDKHDLFIVTYRSFLTSFRFTRKEKPYSYARGVQNRNSDYSIILNPLYPEDLDDFTTDGVAYKELNGRTLLWDVDKQERTL